MQESEKPLEAKEVINRWFVINSLLLASVGAIDFLIFLEFGSQGLRFVTYSSILVSLSVIVGHWYVLRKQTFASSWILRTSTVWFIGTIAIIVFFLDRAEGMSSALQAPTGFGIIFLCPFAAAIGPIVTLFAYIIIKANQLS